MTGYARGPARPFLKWAGGKTQIIDRIWENLPQSFNDYYEPFLGGGAVFFLLFNNQVKIPTTNRRRRRKFIVSDKNEDLINTFEIIRDELDDLLSKLSSLQTMINKMDYYRVRKQQPVNKVKRAARFIYLNKTCYNGLYRVNKDGKFNVPWNRVEGVRIYDPRNLQEVSTALRHVELHCGDFETTLSGAGKDDFVYADPPYYIDGFSHYTANGFVKEDQQRLARQLTRLAEMGCNVLHSNAKIELIENLYPDTMFCRHVIQSRRMINRDGTGRMPISELLIRSYPEMDTIGWGFEQKLLIE